MTDQEFEERSKRFLDELKKRGHAAVRKAEQFDKERRLSGERYQSGVAAAFFDAYALFNQIVTEGAKT